MEQQTLFLILDTVVLIVTSFCLFYCTFYAFYIFCFVVAFKDSLFLSFSSIFIILGALFVSRSYAFSPLRGAMRYVMCSVVVLLLSFDLFSFFVLLFSFCFVFAFLESVCGGVIVPLCIGIYDFYFVCAVYYFVLCFTFCKVKRQP
jgi:hypothetical protein